MELAGFIIPGQSAFTQTREGRIVDVNGNFY